MRSCLSTAVVISLLPLLGIQVAIGQPEELAKIMRQKLTYAQAILEGVTTEDYKKVTDSTEPLLALTNRAEWNAIDRPEYASFSIEFRRAVRALSNSALQRSPEGVAYNYVQMIMACVSCHRFVRAVRKA
jgi:hypothetical protein